jgi:hypothetical protein
MACAAFVFLAGWLRFFSIIRQGPHQPERDRKTKRGQNGNNHQRICAQAAAVSYNLDQGDRHPYKEGCHEIHGQSRALSVLSSFTSFYVVCAFALCVSRA